MKKTIVSLIFALVMALSFGLAQAETSPIVEPEEGKVTPVESGASCDLNGDGKAEQITYEVHNDDTGATETYVKLTVGDQELKIEGWYMDEKVYLLKVQFNTYLLVFDYGPSDDPETHFIYLDDNGKLQDAGSILANPNDMVVNRGIITGSVRGTVLYTWYHDADYMIANNIMEGGTRHVVNLPRPFYAMGLVVKAKVDVPLYAQQGGDSVALTVKAGDTVILSGSDDKQWIYVTDKDGDNGGWLAVGGEYGIDLIVNGQTMSGSDVFDGLLFAD